jgi:hypothetical protein
MSQREPSLGSSKPQRLASSNESGIVVTAPQLAQFKSTSSVGGLVMVHWTPLMIKDPEPQLWQANSFASISWRRHDARSPETYMPAGYHAVYLSAFRESQVTFYRSEGPTSRNGEYTNFRELRKDDVRRIPLLRRWVNEGSPKLRMASRGGRRGLLRAQTPCVAIWRARQRPREPEGAPRGPPAPERAAGRRESPSPAQPRCRRDTWGPRCRV